MHSLRRPRAKALVFFFPWQRRRSKAKQKNTAGVKPAISYLYQDALAPSDHLNSHAWREGLLAEKRETGREKTEELFPSFTLHQPAQSTKNGGCPHPPPADLLRPSIMPTNAGMSHPVAIQAHACTRHKPFFPSSYACCECTEVGLTQPTWRPLLILDCFLDQVDTSSLQLPPSQQKACSNQTTPPRLRGTPARAG